MRTPFSSQSSRATVFLQEKTTANIRSRKGRDNIIRTLSSLEHEDSLRKDVLLHVFEQAVIWNSKHLSLILEDNGIYDLPNLWDNSDVSRFMFKSLSNQTDLDVDKNILVDWLSEICSKIPPKDFVDLIHSTEPSNSAFLLYSHIGRKIGIEDQLLTTNAFDSIYNKMIINKSTNNADSYNLIVDLDSHFSGIINIRDIANYLSYEDELKDIGLIKRSAKEFISKFDIASSSAADISEFSILMSSYIDYALDRLIEIDPEDILMAKNKVIISTLHTHYFYDSGNETILKLRQLVDRISESSRISPLIEVIGKGFNVLTYELLRSSKSKNLELPIFLPDNIFKAMFELDFIKNEVPYPIDDTGNEAIRDLIMKSRIGDCFLESCDITLEETKEFKNKVFESDDDKLNFVICNIMKECYMLDEKNYGSKISLSHIRKMPFINNFVMCSLSSMKKVGINYTAQSNHIFEEQSLYDCVDHVDLELFVHCFKDTFKYLTYNLSDKQLIDNTKADEVFIRELISKGRIDPSNAIKLSNKNKKHIISNDMGI